MSGLWRSALAVLAVVVAVWFAVDWIFTTDRERVEALLVRLIERAEAGGEDAVDEILAAFADDYEGEGAYARDRIERALRKHVAPGRIRSIVRGGFKTLWIGGDIAVPLLRLTVDADRGGPSGTLLLEVHFREQQPDDWRIVSVRRARIGR